MQRTRENIQATGATGDPPVSFTYNELLAELADEMTIKPRPANSVTARELSTASGRGYNVCKIELERRKKAGELYGDNFIIDGHPVMVYWRAEEYDPMDAVKHCTECGSQLQAVRPGKWQCPKCE